MAINKDMQFNRTDCFPTFNGWLDCRSIDGHALLKHSFVVFEERLAFQSRRKEQTIQYPPNKLSVSSRATIILIDCHLINDIGTWNGVQGRTPEDGHAVLCPPKTPQIHYWRVTQLDTSETVFVALERPSSALNPITYRIAASLRNNLVLCWSSSPTLSGGADRLICLWISSSHHHDRARRPQPQEGCSDNENLLMVCLCQEFPTHQAESHSTISTSQAAQKRQHQ